MAFGLKRKKAPAELSYEESKALAEGGSDKDRADLASRQDLRPELLYYLSQDPSSEVRRRIAANDKTPRQADLILARDNDEKVRAELATKVAELTRQENPGTQEKAQHFVVETLELLAKDQATQVRQILAETLKSVANAPPQVIQRLARDAEDIVACPVLEFSPLLSDEDLLEIIASSVSGARLCAISRREHVGEAVSDAIVRRDDRRAVAELLGNDSAQIREETLDALIDGSASEPSWQQPLVERPKLSSKAVRKLASLVAESLLEKLKQRNDIDKETAEAVAKEVRRRVAESAPAEAAEPAFSGAEEAARLFKAGKLNNEVLGDAVLAGKREFVCHGLALLGEIDVGLVERVLSGRSAKGVTALAWKAGCSMRMALQLQTNMGGIPPNKALHARNGTDFPLSPEEMKWQLDFFASLTD
ncbi:DUF2336 domain-containing protein [Pelagibius sp.]|uniref:DUF2336 domain-containing protein n=1 Tax=Pelagibius sp. TaxID=1931238 RepID=UPI00260CCC23|nr:DUF2336 domain-containing protein [Pelagibius sp.]